MKNLLFLIALCFSTLSFGQVNLNTYSSECVLLKQESYDNAFVWTISDDNTLITVTTFDKSQNIVEQLEFTCIATRQSEFTNDFKVLLPGNEDGKWFIMAFWRDLSPPNKPMVIYEFSDQHLSFYGAIKY